jgi:DnaJ-class molecular chaperone
MFSRHPGNDPRTVSVEEDRTALGLPFLRWKIVIPRARFLGRRISMVECVECGADLDDGEGAHVCAECAATNQVEAYEERGETVDRWAVCPLCNGSGRCFFCSPGGPCYHCSGSGREMPGSQEECHICAGDGSVDKGCSMCDYTRRCKHCDGTGRVPAKVLRDG